jgi:hypothetical protein
VHWCKKIFQKILSLQFTSELGVAVDQEEAQQDENKKLGVEEMGKRKGRHLERERIDASSCFSPPKHAFRVWSFLQ